MNFIVVLLVYILFFIIGLAGQMLILKLQSSTTLDYDADFAKNAKLMLTVFIIMAGLITMFWSYWNLLAIPIGVVALFLGENWYYKMSYQKKLREEKEYVDNMKEVEEQIDNYFD